MFGLGRSDVCLNYEGIFTVIIIIAQKLVLVKTTYSQLEEYGMQDID